MKLEHQAESSTKAQTFVLPEGLALPLEVRVHGRGGQGGVTCAKLIAALYTRMGLHVQTFGDYGSERSGAPVQAYTRVDRIGITNSNKIYQPDHLIVLDEGLMGAQVLTGAGVGAVLLLNTAASLGSFARQYASYRFGVIDATAIAREHGIGSSSVVIINTTILGAYARLLGLPLKMLEQAYLSLGLGGDLPAAQHAYEQMSMREADAPGAGSGGSAAPAGVALAAVEPMSAHSKDIPANLKTATWSKQAPQYREHQAPCNVACPADNDVVGFVQALQRGHIQEAVSILLRTQALPSVCGRVCPAPCMHACNRAFFDGAVNIRSLERWIADHSSFAPTRQTAAAPRRFAVVGGGPAGLSAAYQLAVRGHEVTIYEAGPALGGVLRNGIPTFRLPAEILQRDLDRILALGVKVLCNAVADKSDLERLQTEYDALLVCTGFGAALGLGVQGEDLSCMEQGLDFLDRVKLASVHVSGHVVVVGGGNTAIDCARSALRCGAASVKIVYRRSREEMPAIAEEIEEAEAEGVRLIVHRQPVAFTGDGAVSAVVLAEMQAGAPDASGRRRPVLTDRTSALACDRVLLALGQRAGLAFMPAAWQVRDGRAWLDSGALRVWFAGDCASADGTVTHAIGNGRRIALAALAALDGQSPEQPSPASSKPVAPAQIRFSHFDTIPPHRDRELAPSLRRENFEESNLGLSGPDEADRCFSCGHCTQCDNCLIYCPDSVIFRKADGYRIDGDYCKGCGMCVAECPRNAMEMRDKNQLEVSV